MCFERGLGGNFAPGNGSLQDWRELDIETSGK